MNFKNTKDQTKKLGIFFGGFIIFPQKSKQKRWKSAKQLKIPAPDQYFGYFFFTYHSIGNAL